MTLSIKTWTKLTVISVMLSMYFSGYLLADYFFVSKEWLYITGFWVGMLYHTIEISIRNKFAEVEKSKLKYYPPKS